MIPLKNPCFAEQVSLAPIIHILMIVLGIAVEKIEDVLHAQFADCLASLNGCFCELALCFLQFEDTLFDRVMDREAVDSYIDCLIEAMNSIDGLLFYELSSW